MLMQNLGGQTKSIMVFSEVAYRGRAEAPGLILEDTHVKAYTPCEQNVTRLFDKHS